VSKAYDLLIGASEGVGASAWALWVALATVALKICLTRWSRRIGLEAENPAVLALAADHRNDVFAAAGAAVGIYLGQRGHPWVDPAAGALVALIVLLTGIEILRDAAAELTYAVPGEEVARRVIAVATAIPGVVEVEELHGHRFGPYLIINVVIGVDGSISVTAGDAIASRVEELLMEKIELIRRVYVHFHPAADRKRGEGFRNADRAPTD